MAVILLGDALSRTSRDIFGPGTLEAHESGGAVSIGVAVPLAQSARGVSGAVPHKGQLRQRLRCLCGGCGGSGGHSGLRRRGLRRLIISSIIDGGCAPIGIEAVIVPPPPVPFAPRHILVSAPLIAYEVARAVPIGVAVALTLIARESGGAFSSDQIIPRGYRMDEPGSRRFIVVVVVVVAGEGQEFFPLEAGRIVRGGQAELLRDMPRVDRERGNVLLVVVMIHVVEPGPDEDLIHIRIVARGQFYVISIVGGHAQVLLPGVIEHEPPSAAIRTIRTIDKVLKARVGGAQLQFESRSGGGWIAQVVGLDRPAPLLSLVGVVSGLVVRTTSSVGGGSVAGLAWFRRRG
mmetsp:Transcript_41151/g.124347  ORF Transcript_41151/g.124347 Transcript_41151/m.124347 type:complete len:348 (-) Transcript_41151:212-1255(-)